MKDDQQKEEEVQAQFIDPVSTSFVVWLLKTIAGAILWSAVAFFTKLGLGRFWKK